MVPNQAMLLKFLNEIQEDTNKVLTNQWFTKSQWIQWNSDKQCFEYEDDAFLGYTPQEVIKTYEDAILSGFGRWINTASWCIKTRN